MSSVGMETKAQRKLYRAADLAQDRSKHPAMTPPGSYARLTGVDGRFKGSFRRFPGFRRVLEIADVPIKKYDGTTNMPSAGFTPQNVWFFKHVTIRTAIGIDPDTKLPLTGARERILRGFVVAQDYSDSSTVPQLGYLGVLRFIYYDRENAAWASTTLLMERGSVSSGVGSPEYRFLIDASHTNFTSGGPIFSADMDVDACAMGPFLYFCAGRAVPKGQLFSAGNQATVPRDYYRKSVRFVSTGLNTIVPHFTEFGPLQDPTLSTSPSVSNSGGGGILQKKVRINMRTFSALKNVRGPLINEQDVDASTGSPPNYIVWDDQANAWPNVVSLGVDDDSMESRVRLNRSLDSYYFETDGVGQGIDVIAGRMFEEREIQVKVNDNYGTNSGGYDRPGSGAVAEFNGRWGYNVSDTALATQREVRRLQDDTAYAPRRIKLMQPYQGTLLRVGTQPLLPAPAVNVERSEMLSWGSLKRYAPEECRVPDSTPLGDGWDETILSLVQGGDFAFAVGDTSVYRIHRSGQVMAINVVSSLAGGAGRYGSCGAGNSAFVVTPTGVALVDGPTGGFQMVDALDRVIQEDWRGQLAHVHLSYDVRLGALFVYNKAVKEAVLLWNNSGAITTLAGMTYSKTSQGVNPTDAGFHRSFWITDQGRITTPNAEFDGSDAFFTMDGVMRDETAVVSFIKGGPTSFPWIDPVNRNRVYIRSGPTPDDVPRGARIVFSGGANDGLVRYCAPLVANAFTSQGAFLVLTEPVPYDLEEGDRMFISPVEFEIIGWPVQDENVGLDPTGRTSIQRMGQTARVLGGDGAADVDLRGIEHRVYSDESLSVPLGNVTTGVLGAQLQDGYAKLEINGEVLLPAWRQVTADLDFELLAGEVFATMHRAEGYTDPAASRES